MSVALWFCSAIWAFVMAAGAIGDNLWVVGIGLGFAFFCAICAIYADA